MIKKIVGLFLTLTFIIGCGSNKLKLEKKALIDIEKAQYSNWVSGIKGGGAGLNINVSINKKDIGKKLTGIYFRGKYTDLKFGNPNVYSGFIRTQEKEETNFDAMNSQVKEKKEVIKENVFPFVLKENEAVMVCLIKAKKKYFKIIIEKKNVGIPQ